VGGFLRSHRRTDRRVARCAVAQSGDTAETDIFTAIKSDHDTHRALLDRIEDTSGDSQDRRDAWEDFYTHVKSHAAAEEETFYSRMIEKTWGQDMARHSVHEHQELDDLLEDLNQTDMSEGA